MANRTWSGSVPALDLTKMKALPEEDSLPSERSNSLPNALPIERARSKTTNDAEIPRAAPSPKDQEWLDNLQPRRNREGSLPGANHATYSGPGMSMKHASLLIETIEKRSTMKVTKTGTLKLTKSSNLLGKINSFGIKGTVFSLEKNQFDDFPELSFQSITEPTLQLDKKQQKEYEILVEEITQERTRLLAERDAAVKQQQKREERVTKDFQTEMNQRATEKIQEFQKRHNQFKKERKITKDPMPKEESEKIMQEYEQNIMKELERKQTELENRLIKQRLKWILPWFQKIRATELMHYIQLQSMAIVHLEELQQDERRQMEIKEEYIAKLDAEGFDKELKGTIKERKKANRPMAQEEINWEKEIFLKTQEERFEEHLAKLEAEHQKMRDQLMQDHRRQLEKLIDYYDQLERLFLTQQELSLN